MVNDDIKIVLDEEFCFGFSLVNETELQKSHEHNQEVIKNVQNYADIQEDRFNKLYSMVMPLLNNLKKDPDRDYILWPDRVNKINEFIKKINAVKGT